MSQIQTFGRQSGPRRHSERGRLRSLLQWGNLGERWGLNRSVSQVHALLYASRTPLAAEDIADALGLARSNVSNSLRDLQSWNLIRSVPVLGDRRTFYEAETDLWTLVSRIAAGRKARELDPAAVALRDCVELARKDQKFDPVVERRHRPIDRSWRKERVMNQVIALGTIVVLSLVISSVLVAAIAKPLRAVLEHLCPSANAASFWVTFTAVTLYVTPLLIAVLTVNEVNPNAVAGAA